MHGTAYSGAVGAILASVSHKREVLDGALVLLQVQRVAGEHRLRADLARQDRLVLRKLGHGFHRLAVASQAVAMVSNLQCMFSARV